MKTCLRPGSKYLCIEEKTGKSMFATFIHEVNPQVSDKLVFADGSWIATQSADFTLGPNNTLIFHG